MKKIFFLILTVIACHPSIAQQSLKVFPGELNVQPFTANTLEPKLGFLFHVNDNELRLDVGNSVDALHIITRNSETISVGLDLFTYTLLRGETDFHFPVDAVDYLFGLNSSYKKSTGCGEYGLRFRLSHISAHFVDGHYDNKSQGWRDGQVPRVYSREFIELMPFIKLHDLRLYAGFTYIFHVDPVDLGKDSYQIGFDYFYLNGFSDYVTPFIAYDLKLVNIHSYSGNNSISAGVKIGNPFGRGISVYYNFYSGNNIHGQYFDSRVNYSAVGINLDL